jgi:hypothetical protein
MRSHNDIGVGEVDVNVIADGLLSGVLASAREVQSCAIAVSRITSTTAAGSGIPPA